VNDSVTIALSVHAPRKARQFFDRYVGRLHPTLLDDVRILASEIVSNAVRHSGRPPGDPIKLIASVTTETMRVEVVDQGRGVEALRPRCEMPPSGLQYVNLISDRWSSSIERSFHVWFEIDVRSNALIIRR